MSSIPSLLPDIGGERNYGVPNGTLLFGRLLDVEQVRTRAVSGPDAVGGLQGDRRRVERA